MIDTTLIDHLTVLANKEKKLKEYKRRLRIKGEVVGKTISKTGNIILKVIREENNYKFTVIKSHKDRFTIAENLTVGRSVSAEGIPRFKMIICTRLTVLEKKIDHSKQVKLKY